MVDELSMLSKFTQEQLIVTLVVNRLDEQKNSCWYQREHQGQGKIGSKK